MSNKGKSKANIPTISTVKQFQGSKKQHVVYQMSSSNGEIRRKRSGSFSGVIKAAKPFIAHPRSSLVEFLLPKNYETTVEKEYVSFAKWGVISSLFMTLTSIMSMQALLFAIGLSASAALPMSAALNWILKDGLGQLGGMICASFINSKFDAHPKQWRFLAGAILDAAFLLETLTPMFPALFLPLASVANIGKNIGWISASASRAAIHKSFMKTENLADITAKAGSQSIFSSVIGTGLGITIAPALNSITGYENVYVDSPLLVVAIASGFCFCHLFSLRKSLLFVSVKTFDVDRLFKSCYDKIEVSVSNVAQLKKQIDGDAKQLLLSAQADTELSNEVDRVFSTQFDRFRSPKEVAKLDSIFSLKAYSPRDSMKHSELAQPLLAAKKTDVTIEISPNLEALSSKEKQNLFDALCSFPVQQVYLRLHESAVLLFIRDSASSNDVLKGALAAMFCVKLLEQGSSDLSTELIETIAQVLGERHFEQLEHNLQRQGWETQFHFLELEDRRLLVE